MEGPIKRAGEHERPQDPEMDQVRNASRSRTNTPRRLTTASGSLDPFAMGNGASGLSSRVGAGIPDMDPSGLYEGRGGGRGKVCGACGRLMKKSTRMILSPLAAITVIVLGGLLMFFYGMATNFLQVPWSIKFALPAAYYIGSLFVGLGILFFFIREKVWFCQGCKGMDKR